MFGKEDFKYVITVVNTLAMNVESLHLCKDLKDAESRFLLECENYFPHFKEYSEEDIECILSNQHDYYNNTCINIQSVEDLDVIFFKHSIIPCQVDIKLEKPNLPEK